MIFCDGCPFENSCDLDHCACDDDEVCDYCGEPLGFCAVDCETREEDFEE